MANHGARVGQTGKPTRGAGHGARGDVERLACLSPIAAYGI
jgi:hypothetical protein